MRINKIKHQIPEIDLKFERLETVEHRGGPAFTHEGIYTRAVFTFNGYELHSQETGRTGYVLLKDGERLHYSISQRDMIKYIRKEKLWKVKLQ